MAITLEQVVLDARNALELAQFYATVLEREVDPGGSEFFATVGKSGDAPLSPIFMFMQIPDEKTGKNRLHVDLVATDYQNHVQRALAAGATHVGDFNEYGTEWTTLLDPEGNAFDIGKGIGEG